MSMIVTKQEWLSSGVNMNGWLWLLFNHAGVLLKGNNMPVEPQQTYIQLNLIPCKVIFSNILLTLLLGKQSSNNILKPVLNGYCLNHQKNMDQT